MKKLYLVRHAKSSWDNPDFSDFDRPLNKRGKHDAPFMGKLLKKENVKPDLIYSSPAVRAITTAQIFADELDYPKKKIVESISIYESGIKELEEIVQKISEEHKSVLIFGHNPALTSFANHLGNKFIDNVPTCAVVGIEFDVKNWKQVEHGTGKTFMFDFPKKYFQK
ncbi:MAG: phosphohistidine phosphatase SixA [Ignavibacteriales bacterium]|nr:phosphohistidine phosphatase SixA [Ignavibacteriales bacterium]